MKFCHKCQTNRSKADFNVRRRSKDGLDTKCRFCAKVYKQQNKEKLAAQKSVWYRANRDKVLRYANDYYKQNRKQVIAKTIARQLLQRKSDPAQRAAHNLSSRLSKILKSKYSRHYAIEFLGCDLIQLRKHLESKFKPGMSWENYGKWHIDHIKPLSVFDLLDIQQVKEAFHYTNLQPLWAIENIQKSNKVQ